MDDALVMMLLLVIAFCVGWESAYHVREERIRQGSVKVVLKGKKTLIVAVLQFAAGVIAVSTDAVAGLPDEAGWSLIASAVVFGVLRFVTSTPVFQST